MVTLIIVMKLLQIIERKTSNSKKKKKKNYSSFKKENIIGIPTFSTKKKKMIDISINMWYAFCMDFD